jgi:hypothetical protein
MLDGFVAHERDEGSPVICKGVNQPDGSKFDRRISNIEFVSVVSAHGCVGRSVQHVGRAPFRGACFLSLSGKLHPPRKRSMEERPLQTFHEAPAPHDDQRDGTGEKNSCHTLFWFSLKKAEARIVAEMNFWAREAPFDSSKPDERRTMRQAKALCGFRMFLPTPRDLVMARAKALFQFL